MKIAYLVIAHGNYAHVDKLLPTIRHPQAGIYLHIDAKSELPPNLPDWPELHVLENRIAVYWANFSQVEATLLLLKEALKKQYDYYFLISGIDYPIRPLSFLINRLSEGGEFINMIKGFEPHKPKSRIDRFYFQHFDRRNYFNLKTVFYLGLEKTLALFYRRKFPFGQIYFGANWFALTHNCCAYILDFVAKNPAYEKFYRTTIYPDESFFHTIIGQSPFAKQTKNNLTYADWSVVPAPAIINHTHVDAFLTTDTFTCETGPHRPYMARKFNDDTLDVAARIDRELRHVE